MAKISRPDKNVQAFASIAQAGERYIFGDPSTTSDDLTDNLNDDFLRGWAAGLDPVNGYPPMSWFNAQMFTTSGLASYLFQHGGISEWNTNQEYYHPAFCTGSDGKLYASVQDNTGANPVTDGGLNWRLSPSEIASLLDAQTGVDNTKIMTPERVSDARGVSGQWKSIGGGLGIEFPNSFKIQWNSVSFPTAGDSTLAVTFPTAFTSAPPVAMWTIRDAGVLTQVIGTYVSNVTSTGMQLVADKNASQTITVDAHYFVMGF